MKFSASVLATLLAVVSSVSAAAISPLSPDVSVAGTEEYTHTLERRATGDATWYDVQAGYTACGMLVKNTSYTVAVSAARYDATKVDGNPNNNKICGRKIRVRGPLRTLDGFVRDRCAGCKYDDVDLSPTLFQQIVGPLGIGRRQITWDYV
ncbi:hypothetical protein BDV98DRAFT_598204 [Pterulicium gracile]|uniref:RlpA-like double-psi beta-barrel-protein domain-containing protein-containing protein n=1 Tax=Pterulicium gracile TaxID=1884261 RepID=A0A5C3Q1Z2_9AGAR|nr:hypothetical protein BDV98DRAFT_598204 [Pterula gracilis]